MKKVRILSLDGGGIRGIIPATVVKHIEKKLQEKTKKPNARIADYFDLIVGTSTGGILTCFYLTPNDKKVGKLPVSKYTAAQALEFYSEKGYDIFNKSKYKSWFGMRQFFNSTQYNPTTIEKIFLETFGDLKLSDLLQQCLVTTYDIKEKTSFFFSNKESKEKNRNFYVRDVVRATSAAPTYFPPAEIINIITKEKMINVDGGVFANNPTMCAYAESRNSVYEQVAHPSAKDMLILSIGTGGGQFELKNVNKSGKWSVINWAKAIPDIMMDGSIDIVHYQIKRMFETLNKEHQYNYKRIDVPINKRNYSPDMANASPENIEKLKQAGLYALDDANTEKENNIILDDFIDLLIGDNINPENS